MPGGIGDTLGVIAGAACNNATPVIATVKVSHFVADTAQLAAKYGLQVLALEQDSALETVAEVCRVCEGRLGCNIVDA